MDNVTHGLVGYALARAALIEAQPSTGQKRALIWTGVLSSNLPDGDIVVRAFVRDAQLGYLLQHRGPTHSLLCALALGIATAWICAALCGLRSARELGRCCALGALGGLLHVAADGLNNYGVHPFSPFDDHWFYGDSLFIIEPLLFVALLPLLAWNGYSAAARWFGFALALALEGLIWTRREAPLGVALAISLLMLSSFLVQRRSRRPALAALAGTLLVVVGFGLAAQRSRGIALRTLAERAPRERVLDIVLTPAPGNPFCFGALLLTLDGSGMYRAHFAQIAMIGLSKCQLQPGGPISAPLEPDTLAEAPNLRFEAAFSGKAAELRALAGSYCDARALLRFARAPFWTALAARPVLGDLRYDSSPGLDFADRMLTDRCPDPVPRWVPPRSDLLGDALE